MAKCVYVVKAHSSMHNLFIRSIDSKKSQRRRVFVQSVMAVFMLALSHRLVEGKVADCMLRYFIDASSQEISIHIIVNFNRTYLC